MIEAVEAGGGSGYRSEDGGEVMSGPVRIRTARPEKWLESEIRSGSTD
jgi:hypothetical protein